MFACLFKIKEKCSSLGVLKLLSFVLCIIMPNANVLPKIIRLFFSQGSENYILSTDTRSQLKFLEKLDQLEKQRKDLEEREMLLRAAKVKHCVAYRNVAWQCDRNRLHH